jgi:hypothetical protein
MIAASNVSRNKIKNAGTLKSCTTILKTLLESRSVHCKDYNPKKKFQKEFFPHVKSSLHAEGGRLADCFYSAICAHDQMCNGERNKRVEGRNLDCSCAAWNKAEESVLRQGERRSVYSTREARDVVGDRTLPSHSWRVHLMRNQWRHVLTFPCSHVPCSHLLLFEAALGWAGMNQQPPIHHLRMRPLKLFWGWTKNTSSLPKVIGFVYLFFASKFFPPMYLPPTYLPPDFALTPLPKQLGSHWSRSESRASVLEAGPRTWIVRALERLKREPRGT